MVGTHEAEVWKYVDEVLDGTRPACVELRQACERFRDDWISGKWDINPYEADYIIDKIQTQFIHRKGETLDGTPLKGTPLLLESWQKFCIYGMFVFYTPGTKLRRVKEAFIFIPRKNGKTLFVSAVC